MNKDKLVLSIIKSAIITIIFIALITIGADLYVPLKDWLKVTFSHHWVGKGILSAILFAVLIVIFNFVIKDSSIKKVTKKLYILFWVTGLSGAAIVAFFLWETFAR